jgi:hypothetical protein
VSVRVDPNEAETAFFDGSGSEVEKEPGGLRVDVTPL